MRSGNQKQAESGEFLQSKAQVLAYLQEAGWQIRRNQFYLHCKDGKVPRQKDGTYTRADADSYAIAHCRRIETGEKVETASLAKQKAIVQLRREKARAEREEFELKARLGQFVPAEAVEDMIIGRALAFMSHLRAMVLMGVPEWRAMVEDGATDRELIETIQGAIDVHLANFARDVEFEAILEQPAAAGEDDHQ